jgi:hypothetical protein
MGCQPGGSCNTNKTHKQIHITTTNTHNNNTHHGLICALLFYLSKYMEFYFVNFPLSKH